jgi:hypothetical protein
MLVTKATGLGVVARNWVVDRSTFPNSLAAAEFSLNEL